MKVKRLVLMVIMTALALEEILSFVNTAVVLTSMSKSKKVDSDVIVPTATPAPISALFAFTTATFMKPISKAKYSLEESLL